MSIEHKILRTAQKLGCSYIEAAETMIFVIIVPGSGTKATLQGLSKATIEARQISGSYIEPI